jgi:hypothetical protein
VRAPASDSGQSGMTGDSDLTSGSDIVPTGRHVSKAPKVEPAGTAAFGGAKRSLTEALMSVKCNKRPAPKSRSRRPLMQELFKRDWPAARDLLNGAPVEMPKSPYRPAIRPIFLPGRAHRDKPPSLTLQIHLIQRWSMRMVPVRSPLDNVII